MIQSKTTNKKWDVTKSLSQFLDISTVIENYYIRDKKMCKSFFIHESKYFWQLHCFLLYDGIF